MNVKYVFFDKFYVAGATYSCDFDRVIDEIPLGAEVCFKREPDNAVDAYNEACDFIGFKADGTVVNGWTGRMPHTQAIPD